MNRIPLSTSEVSVYQANWIEFQKNCRPEKKNFNVEIKNVFIHTSEPLLTLLKEEETSALTVCRIERNKLHKKWFSFHFFNSERTYNARAKSLISIGCVICNNSIIFLINCVVTWAACLLEPFASLFVALFFAIWEASDYVFSFQIDGIMRQLKVTKELLYFSFRVLKIFSLNFIFAFRTVRRTCIEKNSFQNEHF